MNPALKTALLWIGGILGWLVLLGTFALFASGCQHAAPARIELPSTVAVKRAVAVVATHADRASASNARAVAIARKALLSGIAAGSQDAQDLADSTQATDGALIAVKASLAAADASIDALTTAQAAKQKQVDAQTGRLAYLEPKYEAAVKTIWWYRLRCWGLVAVSALIFGVVLVAKFTKWGTATLGPYLVDAGHLAAKAAPLIALA